jgi:uroporphyrinogen decarboxylase
VLPYTKRIFDGLGPTVPRIHFATGNPALLPLVGSVDCEAVSVDWRLPLDEAWDRIGDHAIQGNLDPAVCLAPWDVVRARTDDVLRRAGGRAGHVFNLGHGVLPDTDADTLARLSSHVREQTAAVAV